MKRTLLILVVSLTCFPFHTDAACIWKNIITSFTVRDSCGSSYKQIYGLVTLNNSSGITYDWKVVGSTVNWTNTNSSYLYYPGSNGSYTVCLTLRNMAKNCDTTLCKTLNFQCLKPCNWKSQNIYFRKLDSCKSQRSSQNLIGGLIFINNNYFSHYKYQWKVNGTVIAGNSGETYYNLSSNGTYTLCVKVTDSVNNCDTTLCETFVVTCINNCNWKAQNPVFTARDSCNTTGGSYLIAGGISFNGNYSGKYPCEWKVNYNTVAGTGPVLQYNVSSNGTYVICVKVRDTLKNCDTTFCKTVVVNCFPCSNWRSKFTSFYLHDTCDQYPNKIYNRVDGITGRINMVNMADYFYYKFRWTINGKTVNPYGQIDEPLPNGTYTVCLTIRDTIKNCDTSFCRTVTVNCSPCPIWKNLVTSFVVRDSCGASYKLLYGKATLANGYGITYNWKVAGSSINWTNSNSSYIYYPGSNGNYTVCLTLRDTVNNCDTTICKTINFKCLAACKWWKQNINLRSWDSCKNQGRTENSIGGVLFTNNNYESNYDYEWKINGTAVSNASMLHYPLYTNGTYTMCVKVKDTTNNCDTTLCRTYVVSCISNCNWKARKPSLTALDSCNLNTKTYQIMGGISFNGSYSGQFPCEWKVNGSIVSGSGPVFSHKVTGNGTYTICVKVRDTANFCDTVLCRNIVVDCIPCGAWKPLIKTFYVHDTCDQDLSKTNNRLDGLVGWITFSGSAAVSRYQYKWTVNSVPVSSSSRLEQVLGSNGTYTVCLKVRDSVYKCDTTICRNVNVTCFNTGINNVNTPSALIVLYPNPAGSSFSFEWKGDPCRYVLYDALGHEVATGMTSQGSNTLVSSLLSSGVYCLRIYAPEGIWSGRVVISHD